MDSDTICRSDIKNQFIITTDGLKKRLRRKPGRRSSGRESLPFDEGEGQGGGGDRRSPERRATMRGHNGENGMLREPMGILLGTRTSAAN